MTASIHAPKSPRPLRFAISTALVIAGLFASAPSRGASEDPPPGRASTKEDIQALVDKLASPTLFRAVYDFESKTSTGVVTLNFRAPNEGHLSVHLTSKGVGVSLQSDWWLVDGRLTTLMLSPEGNCHAYTSFLEPFQFAEDMRAHLNDRVGGAKDAEGRELSLAFFLNFARDPDNADKILTNAQVRCVPSKSPPRVSWFMNPRVWETSRIVDGRIVVEEDGCRYRFATDSGFLTDATIAEAGAIKLRTLQEEVDAEEFVVGKPAKDSKDNSTEFKSSAWKLGLDLARRHAFECLAQQDEAGKLDDARFGAWRNVVADHYELWITAVSEKKMPALLATVDKFVEWHAQRRAAANGDAAGLEALANETKQWRDKMEAERVSFIDRLATALAVPSDMKITRSTGDRGLDIEREAVRAAGRKVLIDPLLQRLDEGVAAAGERK